jgi:hypothetical protein
MNRIANCLAMASALMACCLLIGAACAQTPEQQQLWDAQRVQAQAEAQARAERLAQQRAARKADPMAWVRTLNPLTTGGWEFRAVAPDGSWAAFSTDHQEKRSGKLITLWLRQEYPEPQRGGSGDLFLSNVETVQFDCGSDRQRLLLVIYYSENNITGSQQQEESDPKHTPWDAVVPGTQSDSVFQWACGKLHAK